MLVDLGGKMDPSWHPNGIHNRSQLRTVINNFVLSTGKTMVLKDLGVEVESKNRSKIEGQDGVPLGIDF